MTERPPGSLGELIRMRWRLYYREPAALFWVYGFPLLLALALGIAFREQPPPAADVAVIQRGDGEAIQAALAGHPGLKVRLLDAAAAERAMQQGQVVLVIDPAEGDRPRSYRYDPTRPEALLARALAHEALERAAGRTDHTAAVDAPRTAPGTRYIDFVVPGLICFNLMSAGLWGVGYVIVEMRVKRLLKRMLATPMSRAHFLFSFVVVRGAFSLVELPVLAGFAALVFKMPIRGSLLLLTALTILGSLVFAAMGLLVAARSTTVQTAGGLINLATLSMTICSGVFFSVERFPAFLQAIINLLPLTAFIDAMRAIMLEGAGLLDLGRPLLVLSAWGGVSFFLALRLFRWR